MLTLYVERYSIPLPDGWQIKMFGSDNSCAPSLFSTSDAFKITCKFSPQCNTTFLYKCQIQTSVLMSRAIHEAISPWLFQDLSIVKKTCGDFGVLGITRLPDFLLRY